VNSKGINNQDVLAARLDTVNEVVAHTLLELKRSGAIQVIRGQIQIMDSDRKKEWSLTSWN
jgi:hypothetical protein